MRPNLLRRIFPLVAVISLVCVTFGAKSSYAWWMYTPGDTVDNVGYKPEQPIPFSHKLHAGDKKIPCQYCHSSARRSTAAGIPPMNTCMGCHKLVATDKPNIKKVTEHFKNNDPIQWVKVHDLPDFVRFSHQVHVNAKLECQDCHGNVQDMDIVEQKAPLQMGWCVECHKAKKAKLDCLACHY